MPNPPKRFRRPPGAVGRASSSLATKAFQEIVSRFARLHSGAPCADQPPPTAWASATSVSFPVATSNRRPCTGIDFGINGWV